MSAVKFMFIMTLFKYFCTYLGFLKMVVYTTVQNLSAVVITLYILLLFWWLTLPALLQEAVFFPKSIVIIDTL